MLRSGARGRAALAGGMSPTGKEPAAITFRVTARSLTAASIHRYAAAPIGPVRRGARESRCLSSEQTELPQQLAPAEPELGQRTNRDQVLGSVPWHARPPQQIR